VTTQGLVQKTSSLTLLMHTDAGQIFLTHIPKMCLNVWNL